MVVMAMHRLMASLVLGNTEPGCGEPSRNAAEPGDAMGRCR